MSVISGETCVVISGCSISIGSIVHNVCKRRKEMFILFIV